MSDTPFKWNKGEEEFLRKVMATSPWQPPDARCYLQRQDHRDFCMGEIERLRKDRDNLQDQRDFAMGEIERLRKERDKFRHALRVIARMDTSRGNTRALLSVAVAKDALGLETPKH